MFGEEEENVYQMKPSSPWPPTGQEPTRSQCGRGFKTLPISWPWLWPICVSLTQSPTEKNQQTYHFITGRESYSFFYFGESLANTALRVVRPQTTASSPKGWEHCYHLHANTRKFSTTAFWSSKPLQYFEKQTNKNPKTLLAPGEKERNDYSWSELKAIV